MGSFVSLLKCKMKLKLIEQKSNIIGTFNILSSYESRFVHTCFNSTITIAENEVKMRRAKIEQKRDIKHPKYICILFIHEWVPGVVLAPRLHVRNLCNVWWTCASVET